MIQGLSLQICFSWTND